MRVIDRADRESSGRRSRTGLGQSGRRGWRRLCSSSGGPNDLGRVIGKQGRTVRAMRNLLGAAGLKFNKRFALEILE